MKAVEGWDSFTVEQCCDILDSMRVPVNTEDRDKRIGEIPYYGANGLQGYIDDFIFDEPLILIAEDGGCFEEFATRPIAYRIKGKSWVNNHAHVLRAKEAFCQDTVFYNLEHKDIQSFIVGGTRSKLNQAALRAITLTLPTSKTEQTKIAGILSTVDRAIEQTEALIAKQQRIKTGLMQDLLTRGIDEHGNLRTEQTHQFKDSPLGRIPVEWEIVQIEKMCSDIVDCPHSTPVYTESGVPCIRTADMEPGHLLLASAFCVDETSYRERVLRLVPQTGDIIYSREGERLGIASPVGVDRICLGQRVMLLRPDSKTDPNYLLWCMNAEDFYIRAVSGLGATTSPHINVKDIRKAQIKKPHENEQKKIGTMLSMQHNQLRTNQENLWKLSRLKTAVMQDLLTGKKRIINALDDIKDIS